MVHIQYKLLPSKIHWIGCFADENISKGFCVVEASPLLDINLTKEQYSELSISEQDEIRHHGHYDKITEKWHVDFDMIRFANHSENPNLIQLYNDKWYYILSLWDIGSWEELTINYSDFEYTNDTRWSNIFL